MVMRAPRRRSPRPRPAPAQTQSFPLLLPTSSPWSDLTSTPSAAGPGPARTSPARCGAVRPAPAAGTCWHTRYITQTPPQHMLPGTAVVPAARHNCGEIRQFNLTNIVKLRLNSGISGNITDANLCVDGLDGAGGPHPGVQQLGPLLPARPRPGQLQRINFRPGPTATKQKYWHHCTGLNSMLFHIYENLQTSEVHWSPLEPTAGCVPRSQWRQDRGRPAGRGGPASWSRSGRWWRGL